MRWPIAGLALVVVATCVACSSGSGASSTATVTVTTAAAGGTAATVTETQSGAGSTVTVTGTQSGAGSTVTVTKAAGAAPTVTVTATVTAPGAASSTEADTESSSETTTDKLGGPGYTYTDGLSVQVSKASPFTPSDTATDNQFKQFVSMTLTLTNGTKANFDPSLFFTNMQSGSAEGDSVYDSAQGVTGPPDTKLLPGRTVKFKIAYGVQDPKDLVLEVTPGLDYESVLFTS